ncbi:thiolase family protein [Cupriavidus necator]|uniref:Thiolase family protein n=1 Tax=Cupriavidus necator TaxID=106590 RepID=A0A367PJY9_CUPNE|nr:thiolase family protein [Cupriavidus necator]QQX82803.1 thiolase family protein [Cupriavidus necator]RCJ07547.1 thiolase family protein [Cupriavidus necator]
MQNSKESIVIVGAKRTPIGAFNGSLAAHRAPDLGAVAIRAAVAQAGVDPASVDEAIMGLCLFAGVGQAPARQAVLGAGLPTSTPATTISKMCGSGMKSVMLAHDLLLAGTCSVAVAGGMESMSNAPHIVPRARQGYRLGHGQLLDHMYCDGLEDAYEGQLMGYYADLAAEARGMGRDAQDAYARESLVRAQAAVAQGRFRDEIAPVAGKRGGEPFAADETPGQCDAARLPKLRAVFRDGGSVTAGNASSISDGAAALVLMREADARRQGIAPLARIVGHATHANPPQQFADAPVLAARRVLEKAGWTPRDVDLYEINEAFAVVTMIALQELGIEHERLNVNGGACALGHPVGATGARLLVTLVHALKQRGLRRGLASLCLGGGEATAVALELC